MEQGRTESIPLRNFWIIFTFDMWFWDCLYSISKKTWLPQNINHVDSN